MSDQNINKEKLIEILIKYLPEVASSLGSLVDNLSHLVGKQSEIDAPTVHKIIDSLEKVLVPIGELTIPYPELKDMARIDPEIHGLFTRGFRTLFDGINLLLDWIKDTTRPEDQLNRSIESLIVGSQLIVQLTERISN